MRVPASGTFELFILRDVRNGLNKLCKVSCVRSVVVYLPPTNYMHALTDSLGNRFLLGQAADLGAQAREVCN